jgi:hypothetical protein
MRITAIRSKTQANIIVDIFAYQLYALLGMRADALVTVMLSRMKHDNGELKRLEGQLEALSSGYHKYLDLRSQIEAHEDSINKLRAIVGYGAPPYDVLEETEPENPEELEYEKASKALRRSLELWEAVEQYLRFVPEAKIKEILDFLDMVKIVASRQSVEAAIKAHPKVFRVQKRRSEKFISLKKGV